MIALKSLVCVAVTGGVYWLCGFLQVDWMIPVSLTLWGSVCLMFAKEFSGRKTVVHDGVEEKTMLYLLWIAAGVICLAIAGIMLYVNS